MSKKLYLHAGFHKTATSSIQRTLFRNRIFFEKNGLYYPDFWLENHSMYLYSLSSDNPEKYHFHIVNKRNNESVREFNKEAEELLIKELKVHSQSNILLSGEGVSLLNKRELRKLKNLLESILPDHKIIVVLATRSHLNLASSLAQEYIRSGKSTQEVEQSLVRILGTYYQKRLGIFLDIFRKEQLRIYSFEEACKDPYGPIGFFLKVINIKEELIKNLPFARTNEGFSDKAIELISYINNQKPLVSNNKLNEGRFKGDVNSFQCIRGQKYQLSSNILDVLRKASEADRIWLDEQMKIKYFDASSTNELVPIKYDKRYYRDVRQALDSSSETIKSLVLSFLSAKMRSGSLSMKEQFYLNKLYKTINLSM